MIFNKFFSRKMFDNSNLLCRTHKVLYTKFEMINKYLAWL